jgi:MoaA/NifB/PqqE/SkfB family radical SAM enzyme
MSSRNPGSGEGIALENRKPAEPVDWDAVVRILAQRWKSLHAPEMGAVTPGYSCSNRCRFCSIHDRRQEGDRTHAGLIQEIEWLASECRVTAIQYAGGEPTLRDDLPLVLSHARALGVTRQVIQTNGRRLQDSGYLEKILDAGATSFFVSIHGCEPDLHDYLTGSKGAFRQTLAGLANLDRHGCEFSTNTVICRQNYTSLGRIVAFLREQLPSLRFCKLSYPNLIGNAAANIHHVVAPLWEVSPHVLEAIERGNECGVCVDTESIPPCLLQGSYDRASELVTRIFDTSDLTHRVEKWILLSKADNNILYETCERCDFRTQCCGIPSLHEATFGANYCFTPVSFGTQV